MSRTFDVAVIVGSPRKGSLNAMLAAELARLAPETLALRNVGIAGLPMYDPDLEADLPVEWARFRDEVRKADALLFVTPEYNRSIPGVLKNAIDVGSRPYGRSVWNNKPGAIVSGSLGGVGGFGANHHLRQCLVFLNVFTLQQPEAYIPAIDRLFDADGRIQKPDTEAFLSAFMATFAQWVARLG